MNETDVTAKRTRIVLGIAAAILFVLAAVAAVAVPWFIDYSKRNRVEEAHGNMGALRAAVVRYCEQRGAFPPAAGPLPASPKEGAQRVNFRDEPTFEALRFDPGGLVFYSYAIEPDGDGVRLVAQGDLDGDGARSTWLVQCRAGCQCDLPVINNADE